MEGNINKDIEECLTPPPGVCWHPILCRDYNCKGCKYIKTCTCKEKGNGIIIEKKTRKKK